MESERVAARLRPSVHGWPLSASLWRAACAGPARLGGGLHDSTRRTALPHLGRMPGPPAHDSIFLKDWSGHQTRDGSRDQSQHQRGHGQQEECSRRADRVFAYAQVGDDGTDEEQHEADCGGSPDQWHTDEADQQSKRARCFEGAQHGQPRFRHARLGRGDEDEFIAHEIGRGREGVSGDGHQGDNDVGGKHSELQSFLDVPSFRYYLTTCVPREAGLLVNSLSHRPGLVRHYYNDTARLGNVTMDVHDWLAQRFEEHRTHLRAVAYRMLGSISEADDAVQEAWLRLSRSDTSGIENLGGWLTTVVGRVCLNMLRSRRSRREEPLGEPQVGVHVPDPIVSRGDRIDPEHEALVADSVGLALLVVLETLTPAERLAFVLHDMFAVPFAEISPIVGRSPNATKMLASRARRRVRGAAEVPDSDPAHQREVVDAFLAASRGGDFGALLAVLDPDVVLRADGAAVRAGASREVRGARAVADTFFGRARFARPALVNGAIGAVWAPGGRPRVAFCFTVVGGKIVEIEVVADPARLSGLDLAVLED